MTFLTQTQCKPNNTASCQEHRFICDISQKSQPFVLSLDGKG